MESIVKTLASAVIAYSVHYSAVKMYDSVCVPDGIWGYVQGLFTMGSPICQAGVQIIQSTQVSYSSMMMMGITRFALDFVMPGTSVAAATTTTVASIAAATGTAAVKAAGASI
jgi:hypothetical protein